MIRYKTNTKAFKWKKVLYTFGDWNLPIPIPIYLAGYFIGAFAVMGVLYLLGLKFNIFIQLILIPALVAYLLSKINPQDKEAGDWIKGFIRSKTTIPKKQWMFKKVEEPKEGVMNDFYIREERK